MARLKAMIESPNRDWIGRPQPPAEYANGTRLFAYRALRSQLTCAQITAALAEIGTAAASFTTPVPGVSAQQVRRVLVLNSEVQRELQAEFTARCKG